MASRNGLIYFQSVLSFDASVANKPSDAQHTILHGFEVWKAQPDRKHPADSSGESDMEGASVSLNMKQYAGSR
jgi:hypothetical protein